VQREQQPRQPAAPKVDDALEQSFPASDPPASHLPDKPPANAEDKWKAAGITRRVADAEQDRRGGAKPASKNSHEDVRPDDAPDKSRRLP
jgi:hypothetical protein